MDNIISLTFTISLQSMVKLIIEVIIAYLVLDLNHLSVAFIKSDLPKLSYTHGSTNRLRSKNTIKLNAVRARKSICFFKI